MALDEQAFKAFQERFINAFRNIPDFPKPGIQFKDLTTVLKDKAVFAETVDVLTEMYKDKNINKIVGIESRGFIFGAALAYKLDAGLILVRKPGKLPAETIKEEYELEYGTDALEIHVDGIEKGDRVLIHDDLLATGGTAEATCKLIERLGGEIAGVCFLTELGFLNGRAKLSKYDVKALATF
ncbi:adenine phosphoribosyltransferase [Chloroherpeton thalassium ATCC 35110]|uniref:Adenine phosphoribosyltransferase n=1 Tax=Chloroherpeton thalassium (strain ATCC 35110 / GB-78) TaxID=517418 RepID=B3QYT8_CHLT3|nr:adenine phosphoribosyltransferase [Chloroherpeton thalassium ATCC 35110]